MKIVSVVGARPQFIKAASVSRVLRRLHREVLVHTGQHYDENMSRIFFEELEVPEPDYNLGVGSGTHARQTARMMEGVEEILVLEKPDRVLVYGDTNSTLAGALAATKLQITVAHVEAGLRSYNRMMPEEINRVVVDHVSDLCLCPSQRAVDNLEAEGVTTGVHLVGDVMVEVLKETVARAREDSGLLECLGLEAGGFLLATVHRAENTNHPRRLSAIIGALAEIDEPVVLPIHPRIRETLSDGETRELGASRLHLIDPVGHVDIIRLALAARRILTDSGGLQKEAYWLGVPCITLREETEWVETVDAGWNVLVGADKNRILEAVGSFEPPTERPPLYGDGRAAERIAAIFGQMNSEMANLIAVPRGSP